MKAVRLEGKDSSDHLVMTDIFQECTSVLYYDCAHSYSNICVKVYTTI